ncbi:hypothetical protein Gohar_018958, partial [Gossypium harknessii]|nr:hypothetical protein [Gossypium harknessii]
ASLQGYGRHCHFCLDFRWLLIRKQHALVLHKQCSGLEDPPYNCPSHESLFHCFRRRSPRFWQDISRQS